MNKKKQTATAKKTPQPTKKEQKQNSIKKTFSEISFEDQLDFLIEEALKIKGDYFPIGKNEKNKFSISNQKFAEFFEIDTDNKVTKTTCYEWKENKKIQLFISEKRKRVSFRLLKKDLETLKKFFNQFFSIFPLNSWSFYSKVEKSFLEKNQNTKKQIKETNNPKTNSSC